MVCFKKKKGQSIVELELNDKLNRVKLAQEHYFYRPIFDEEKSIVDVWCKKHNIVLELSHINAVNKTKIYKFILLS